MRIENRPSNEKQPQLDAEWYPRFEKWGAFEAFNYLAGEKEHRSQQKAKFLAGEIDNPQLDYPKLETDDLIHKEDELLKLKEDVLMYEANPTVKQVYRWRLNEKIAELRMLRATLNMTQAIEKGNQQETIKNLKRFKRYSEFIYGKPSAEIFKYTIQTLKKEIQPHLDNKNPDIQSLAKQLIELLPQDLPTVEMTSLPKQTTVDLAREQTLSEIGDLVNIPESEKFNAKNIKQIFESALETLKARGWQARIDTTTDKTALSVNQEHQKVDIPKNVKLTHERIKALVAHEIGTHVQRRVKGEKSKLMLLGLGLDRYDRGEEGIATMREQTLGEKIDDYSGLDGHLAISLATGLDGQPRNFRQVFDILEKYYTLKNLLIGKELTEAQQAGQDKAYERCVRTFRGTDSKTPGICFTKDIVYREGNIGVWYVIGEKPEEVLRFSVGKYDPANKRHIWILEQLGITDENLESLKK